MIGVVGVDFGTKPAICFATFPKRQQVVAVLSDDELCECIVANLAAIYEVMVDSDDFPGTIDVEKSVGETCDAVTFGGSNDFGVIAFIDFLSPEPTKWQLGLDNGSITPVLYKVSTGGCDISSPSGFYEGDGYTATVSAI